MGLMKLLSAGKSMVGIREGRSKYRVTKANLVPKFNDPGQPAKLAEHEPSGQERKATAKKNPFRTKGESTQLLLPASARAEEPTETDQPGEWLPPVGTVVDREGPAAADAPAAVGTLPVADVKAAVEAAPEAKPARQPKSSGAVRDAAARKSEPNVVAVERARKPKPAMIVRLAALAKGPRRKMPPKTGENWLKKLKVVRNDLSDADLEVVPAKGAAKPPAAGSKPSRGAVARFMKSRKLPRLVTACFTWF